MPPRKPSPAPKPTPIPAKTAREMSQLGKRPAPAKKGK